MRLATTVCLLATLLATACQAAIRAEGKGSPRRSGSGGSGGSSSTMVPGPPTFSGVKQRCETSNVGPPLLRRLTPSEFQNTIVAIFPEIAAGWGGVKLSQDPQSALGLANDAAMLLVGTGTAQQILDTAEDVATRVTADGVLQSVLPCALVPGAGSECAAEFVQSYGRRLFRRPISSDEVTRYTELFSSVSAAGGFKLGLKWTLVGLLQSPHAVYRSEVGETSADGYRLTQHELATELAYAFSGSPPTPELLAKADASQLSSPAVLIDEARALLATEHGHETLREFFRQWSVYPAVLGKVKTNHPEFDQIRSAMVGETQRFIDEVVLVRGGAVRELLTAPYTSLDATLAGFYGYGAAGVSERPALWGIGLLGQGSVLAANAHESSSSPTLRGLFVFQKLLCNARPQPPPQVPAIAPPMPGSTTTRARYELSHDTNEPCASCHRLFDPTGFALEHFDELGRFRADEQGLAIDASGKLVDGAGNEISFNGLSELAARLAELGEVTDCVSGLLAAYTYSGGGGVSCLAESARASLANGEHGLVEYVSRLAGESHFASRAH